MLCTGFFLSLPAIIRLRTAAGKSDDTIVLFLTASFKTIRSLRFTAKSYALLRQRKSEEVTVLGTSPYG